MARENPIRIYYEVPFVYNLTFGAGIEILLYKGKKYLFSHAEDGLPKLIGRFVKKNLYSQNNKSKGFHYHYNSPTDSDVSLFSDLVKKLLEFTSQPKHVSHCKSF